jgi:alpha/beta hydrolase family protein
MAMTSRSLAGLVGAALIACGTVSSAEARITRLNITRIESPTFEGRTFGSVGTYDKFVGRATGEVDPADPRNAVITDLALAPRNARGMVEYETDVMMLRPTDRSKSNHRLWYELTNRGRVLSFAQFNDAAETNDPAKASDAGNGFLMRQGYNILISGWDISAPAGGGSFTMKAPVAVNPDGSTISGPAMEEFVIEDGKTLTGSLTYPAASLDKSKAGLTVRVRYDDPPTAVPAEQWDYASEAGTAIKLTGEATPFRQGTLYEFTYVAKNPVIAGLGFAAVRDLASFARRTEKDDAGTANPFAGDVQQVYTACVSQPCRTMHDFIWLGFNTDDAGGKAVDGIVNWVGGATGMFMNHRFAQPFRTHRQHIGRHYPEFQVPFTNQVVSDPVTGKTDGRLRRCLADNTCPRIFETNSENEYWSKNMAMLHVDTTGKDIGEPENVRAYLVASAPHGGGVPNTGKGYCLQEHNPVVGNAVLRALLVAMDHWVSDGAEPPASRLPRSADGTLVTSDQAHVGYPKIPGVAYNGVMHTGDLWDFGPDIDKGILTTLPPRLVGMPYPALVPKTDGDGNDIAGIRLPEIAAPVATYNGWGMRPSGDGCDHYGQMIPFAKTKAERLASGDPRLSIEERYASNMDYAKAVTDAASALKAQRLLLDEDVQLYARKAGESSVGK